MVCLQPILADASGRAKPGLMPVGFTQQCGSPGQKNVVRVCARLGLVGNISAGLPRLIRGSQPGRAGVTPKGEDARAINRGTPTWR